MEAWWAELSALNKAFFFSAVFFSALFIWQLISMILGADFDSHAMDADVASDVPSGVHADVDLSHEFTDHGGADHGGPPMAGEVTFTFVSLRSLLAFGLLFSWAGALYLLSGAGLVLTLLYSAVWGVLAMFAVAYLMYALLRLQETGDNSVWRAIGEQGTVHLRIPEGGTGQVRVSIGGIIRFVKANARGGVAIPERTTVKVVGIIDDTTIEVEPVSL